MHESLLTLFDKTAVAIRDAVAPIRGEQRRARTDRPGQYAIDVVADRAALEILHRVPLTVVSEESGITGTANAPITVVIDPIDGSSNASRDIPYWATSLCALDRDGPLAAMVINHATGSSFRALRGAGATRDGEPLEPSSATRVEDAVVGISNLPGRVLAWKQFRALGSCALALCDVAYGALDGYFDAGSVHAPWDYLGGLLICTEAGVTIVDAEDRPLGIADPNARRRLVAAGTPQLLQSLRAAAG
ncbi:MAG TPA: inositol monophosphatase [Acidimicrobiia bacterium]|jgi:fructose-1,6-bisphosphatase/inositol monophosphatase family enzyme